MDIKAAFAKDGFNVVKEHTLPNGSRGFLAESILAFNHGTGKKKSAMYVEGTAYDMGFLTGVLAEKEVSEMTGKFADTILVDFIDPDLPEWLALLIGTILKNIVERYSPIVSSTIPDTFKFEMHGIEAGCKSVNPNTRVKYADLFTLNVGFDIVCAWAYAPMNYWVEEVEKMKFMGLLDKDFKFEEEFLNRKFLRMPIMCNGFSVFNSGTVGGTHFMGRDFQFPTANVFQDVATMLIYNPSDGRLPLVSTTAPGLVGSMVAMNNVGVAAGVDMAPAGNNNPKQPGLNSLLLVRHAVEKGSSAQAAAQTMIDAVRGVSWTYLIADGTTNTSVAVEAGMVSDNIDSLSYPPDSIKSILPSQGFLDTNCPDDIQNGLFLRWNNYKYPETFLQFNEALFNYYKKPYSTEYWCNTCFINQTMYDKNCPEFYYFHPQRENYDDLLIITNYFVNPRMRLCQMAPWSSLISVKYWDDVPWRYDALNNILLSEYGTINAEIAWKTINFLSPNLGKYPDYYVYHKSPTITYKDKDGNWKTTIQVHGSTSLMNLTEKKMTSLYGYYADLPIEISLLNYLP